MFLVRKINTRIIKAFRICDEPELMEGYVSRGKAVKMEDGRYKIFSSEAPEGQVCEAGDYIKEDAEGNIYPNHADFFLKHHRKNKNGGFDQIDEPLWAWMYGEPESEEIVFLKENKGLVLSEDNFKEYYTAPLWGTTEKADRNAVLIFYNIVRDDAYRITDIDYNFVSRDVFNKSYKFISGPENATDNNILVVTLSLINKRNYEDEEYQTDEEPVRGSFTNEAPAKYLIRKLYRETYTFFSKIIMLATKECLFDDISGFLPEKDKIGVARDNDNKITTVSFFKQRILNYMKELDTDLFNVRYARENMAGDVQYETEDIFRCVNYEEDNEEDSPAAETMMRVMGEKVDNPWSANVYMDFTGGYRTGSLAGMMVIRCLEVSGYRIRSVVYSFYSNVSGEKNKIIDITKTYRMYDAIIAKALLSEKEYNGIREDKQLILKEQGLDYSEARERGWTKEDVLEFAPPYDGSEPFIFLSYKHEDMLLAQALIKNLHRRGVYRIWYDEGIHPGEEWKKIIQEKLKNCACFIALVTPKYCESEYCKKEFNDSCENNKRILVLHCGTDSLPFLDPGKARKIENYQSVYKTKYKDADFYNKILEDEVIRSFIDKGQRYTGAVFINFSDLPSDQWSEKQRADVEKYGKCIDIRIPEIRPDITDFEMHSLVASYVERILEYNRPTVMVHGDTAFMNRMQAVLKAEDCMVLTAINVRKSKAGASEDEKKVLKFDIIPAGDAIK